VQSKTTRHWLGVVCGEHVLRGVTGGFAQLCHGKEAPLRRMAAGDWLIYYSPSEQMRGGRPTRAFTALGQVVDDRVFAFDMGGGFVPFRRRVRYQAVRAVPLAELHYVLHLTSRPHWGMALRRGHLALDQHDFDIIANAMQAPADPREPPDTFLSWLWC
jgi:hypothetical protein